MVQPDKTVLADLASDDLVYVHSSGTVSDKRGFIDEFLKDRPNSPKRRAQIKRSNVTDNLTVVKAQASSRCWHSRISTGH